MPDSVRPRRCRSMPFVPLVNLSEFVEHDRHDLAEAERHDGEVVAAQAERRRPEQDAEHGGDQRADEEHRPERECARP